MSNKKEADHNAQETLQELLNDKPTKLTLSTGKKVRIKWLCPDALDKIDDIIVEHDNVAKKVDSGEYDISKGNSITRKYYAKIAAAVLLNNYFGIKLFWGIKWRIIHHFWHLNGNDYMMIIAESKKKATEQQYYLAMAYSMTMSDIWMTMTKKEAQAFHRELKSASEQQP